MKMSRYFVLFALLAIPSCGVFSWASTASPDYARIGRETVSALAQGQWAKVEGRFDSQMKAALPADKLSNAWKQIVTKNGAFEHIIGVTIEEKDGYHVAVVSCAFASGNVDVKPVIDATGHIAGLFFAPAAPMASLSGLPPNYTAIGRKTVLALAQGKFSSVESRFDKRLKAGLSESRLSSTWRQITAQAGDFSHISGIRLSQQDGYHIVLATCVFAHSSLNAKVVMDPDGQIAGLFFLPAA